MAKMEKNPLAWVEESRTAREDDGDEKIHHTTYLRPVIKLRLKRFAADLSYELGRPVSMTEVIEEAVQRFIDEYNQRQQGK